MSTNLLELSGVHTHIGAYHILHGVVIELGAVVATIVLGAMGDSNCS